MKLKGPLLFILAYLVCMQTHALTIQWFGTTCVALSAGGKTLLFDPFFDRPGVLETLSPFSYNPQEEVSKKWLSKLPPEHKVIAIFASHSHYDHILDGSNTMKVTGADFYGSPTALQTIREKGIDNKRLHTLEVAKSFSIGGFKITAYPGVHPPHLFSYTLASGALDHPLEKPASMFSYKMGKVYNFVIEHEEGKVLFHPSAYFSKDTPIEKSDLLILGIANRRSSQELIDKVVRPSQASYLISTHHDDLFQKLSGQKPSILFPKDYKEWKTTIKSQLPEIKFIELDYAEKLSLKIN